MTLTLAGLQPWPSIPALANSTGIGTYSISFVAPASSGSDAATVLSLGNVTDSFTVKINGKDVPFIDQLSATADVTPTSARGLTPSK